MAKIKLISQQHPSRKDLKFPNLDEIETANVTECSLLGSDILSNEQKKNAFSFYWKHKKHIDCIVKNTANEYPPSEIEDKNDPRIWKPEYWKWFLRLNNNDLNFIQGLMSALIGKK